VQRNDSLKETAGRLGLRELEIFLAFAKTEHLGRAAEDLGITVPSVQRAVRTLELDLGIPLVERAGRRLHLLAAGQVLAEHTTLLMRARIDAAEAAIAASGRARSQFRLGHGPALGFVVVTRYVTKIRRLHPDTLVQLHQATTNALIDSVLAGEIDAAFVSGSPSRPELRAMHLFNEPALLAMPANDPLASIDECTDIAAFRERGFVTFAEGSANRLALMNMCARAGFRPKIALEVDDICTLEGAVAAGIGIALVPRGTTEHAQPKVARVPITGMAGRRAVTLIFSRSAPRTAMLSSLIAVATPRHRSQR
jgi:DNA-binding transcriptional LysR family regulator